jgi:hypothetical protein
MRIPFWLRLAGCSLLLLVPLPGLATAADKSGKPADEAEEQIIEIEAALERPVEIKDFPERMALAKFLAALEPLVPREKRISFRIDEEAFGKDLPKVAEATVTCPHMKNVTFVTVLRRALRLVSQVEEVDYAIRPEGVVITRPRLASHRCVYDVRSIVRCLPLLLPDMREESQQLYGDLKADDSPALLIRLLLNTVELKPWETVELLNGVRLVVVASPTRHREVANFVASLGNMADVAVIMNARLYEVDRAFYRKHIAPQFADTKDSDRRADVVRIDEALFRKISKEKLLQESEEEKLLPRRVSSFLSWQSAIRYAAGPHPTKSGKTLTGTDLAGVSFDVQPVVSPDRRYLRLHISQKVAQPAGTDRARTLDPATGKDIEVESPNLRRNTVSGLVQIPDAGAILMPVAYRPPGKENADKVWLMVARPFIWIASEVRELRKGGGDLTPQSVWDSEVPKDEPPPTPPVMRLPLNEDVKEVLQAVITDVLTNPDLKSTREFYGTAKDRTLALIDDEKLGWPKEFRPDTHGYKLVQVRDDPFLNRRRILGIRVDKFELKAGKAECGEEPVQVCVFNAGGSAYGGVIGGCTVYYGLKRVGKRWVVECAGLLDP